MIVLLSSDYLCFLFFCGRLDKESSVWEKLKGKAGIYNLKVEN